MKRLNLRNDRANMLPKLGVDEVVSPVDAFILETSVYIDIVRPKSNFVFIEDFDPSTYFVTSGDAIEKTKSLKQALAEYKTDVQRSIEILNYYTDPELELLNIIDAAMQGCDKMLEDLYIAKGENCFLETEWEAHTLCVVPKNPRR